jgi:hypothetical protein
MESNDSSLSGEGEIESGVSPHTGVGFPGSPGRAYNVGTGSGVALPGAPGRVDNSGSPNLELGRLGSAGLSVPSFAPPGPEGPEVPRSGAEWGLTGSGLGAPGLPGTPNGALASAGGTPSGDPAASPPDQVDFGLSGPPGLPLGSARSRASARGVATHGPGAPLAGPSTGHPEIMTISVQDPVSGHLMQQIRMLPAPASPGISLPTQADPPGFTAGAGLQLGRTEVGRPQIPPGLLACPTRVIPRLLERATGEAVFVFLETTPFASLFTSLKRFREDLRKSCPPGESAFQLAYSNALRLALQLTESDFHAMCAAFPLPTPRLYPVSQLLRDVVVRAGRIVVVISDDDDDEIPEPVSALGRVIQRDRPSPGFRPPSTGPVPGLAACPTASASDGDSAVSASTSASSKSRKRKTKAPLTEEQAAEKKRISSLSRHSVKDPKTGRFIRRDNRAAGEGVSVVPALPGSPAPCGVSRSKSRKEVQATLNPRFPTGQWLRPDPQRSPPPLQVPIGGANHLWDRPTSRVLPALGCVGVSPDRVSGLLSSRACPTDCTSHLHWPKRRSHCKSPGWLASVAGGWGNVPSGLRGPSSP